MTQIVIQLSHGFITFVIEEMTYFDCFTAAYLFFMLHSYSVCIRSTLAVLNYIVCCGF